MTDSTDAQLQVAIAEIERLRARIAELEATHTMLVGTFRAAAVGGLDAPATITANHPPSAPPHNERPPIGNDNE